MNAPSATGFTPPPMDRGDRLPDLVLADAAGRQEGFYTRFGGRPIAFVLARDPAEPESAALIEALPRLREASPEPELVVVSGRQVDLSHLAAEPNAVLSLTDPRGEFAGLVRLPKGRGVVLADPDLRLLAVDREPTRQFVDSFSTRLREDLPAQPVVVNPQISPVLMIPNVLTREECRELIEIWHNQGNEESGSFRHQAGETRIVIDHQTKRRRDHHVTSPQLVERLSHIIGRRVIPEIGKAFCFEATRFEEFKIVCYDAEEGGFFRAHRDNVTPANAHRRFAMSLVLNAEEFEGGALRFPEYGPALYLPPTGGAVVFSCSHLHEAQKVTQGRRFVLLSFLFGEAEAQRLAARG